MSCLSPHHCFGPPHVPLILCLNSFRVKNCLSLPVPAATITSASHHSPHRSSGAGAAAGSVAVPSANGRGQAAAALGAAGSGWKLFPAAAEDAQPPPSLTAPFPLASIPPFPSVSQLSPLPSP